MSESHERTARAYLQQLVSRLGGTGPVSDAEVRELTALLEHTAALERRACAEIAEETMRLYGSHAAEQIAERIRARAGSDT
jgi:ribosomal protein L9